jgi:hypothetical protein
MNKTGKLILGGMAFLLIGQSALAQDSTKKDEPKRMAKPAEYFLLEEQFKGPHQDTIIQRWVDKVRGNVCYLYIPITIPTLAPDSNSPKPADNKPAPAVYGPNGIGSISCVKM